MNLKTIGTGLILATLALPAFAEGDAELGKKVFKKCKACHAIGEGAKNKVGPLLTGVIGATYGANPDFKYSKAFVEKNAEGAIWTPENLANYLAKPKKEVPGTKMSFPGLKKEKDVANILAYIASFQPEEEAGETAETEEELAEEQVADTETTTGEENSDESSGENTDETSGENTEETTATTD
ncbi:MAG: cytochrome c family protein [Rhodobacteraceae bacterium]|nr:cytochrome c family protein [Paracoccaceae bacterium]